MEKVISIKSKYNSKKIVIDGIKFDSKAEGEFYIYLKDLKEQGKIKDIILQEKLILQEGFKKDGKTFRPITYTVDFTFTTNTGELIRVDVKGMETQQGNLKRKMYEYKYKEPLYWVAKSKKYGNAAGWIDYDELKKKRREAKKEVVA